MSGVIRATGTLLTGNRCQCGGCGKVFKSVAGFEFHRAGDPARGQERFCLSTEKMRAKGMTTNADGLWVKKEFGGIDKGE